jgi:hypothetical protein
VSTTTEIIRSLHFASLFLMMGGLGAVMVALWRGWREEDFDRQLLAFEDASTGHKLLLLPGTILVGATGVFLAADAEFNFFTTGWLLALEVCYLIILFACVPILGHALNRVQIESLKSKKQKKTTDAMQGLLDDNVPIVMCLIMLFLIPVMIWLPEFKPF